jgi:adenylate cyclase class 2
MAREIEIKFAVNDEEKMVGRLLALGAEKLSEGLEHNIVFDNDELRNKGVLLRLRKTGNGKNVLTFKSRLPSTGFKERDEIEVEVGDFGKAKEILENLGYEIWWIYEKERTNFGFGGTIVSVDRLPFGTFMEIEGSRAGIRAAIAKLGLDPAKGMTDTYLGLYQKHCEEKGIEMENLVFWKKAGPGIG